VKEMANCPSCEAEVERIDITLSNECPKCVDVEKVEEIFRMIYLRGKYDI
jgi:predicted RNA-binding Zn-ribbon protein involved in translation (DUF1610 family)